jgi:hypothetical protein
MRLPGACPGEEEVGNLAPPAPVVAEAPWPAPAPAAAPETAPVVAADLPPPQVRPTPGGLDSEVLLGSPDDVVPAFARQGAARPRSASASRRMRGEAGHADLLRLAESAAADGEWGDVVRYTREGIGDDPRMADLHRRAYEWAHEHLAAAVSHLEGGRYADARTEIEGVSRQMRGDSLGLDAERGLEALETVQHLSYLPDDSAVRRAVRRSMYEKLRGSRWAPLFTEAR